MRSIIIIFIFLTITAIGKSQTAPTCLSESQLLNLQSLPYERVNDFMINLGWSRLDDTENHTARFFDFSLGYSIAKWQNRKSDFIEGVLCLYYQMGKPNMIVYHNPDDVCFNYLLDAQSGIDLIKKTSSDQIKSSSYRKSGGSVLDFREQQNDNSNLRFSLLVYNEVSVNNQIQRIKNEIVRIKTTETGRKGAIKIAMQAGDSLFNAGYYNDSYNQYVNAKNYLKSEEKSLQDAVESKILVCKENKNRVMVENKIKEGDNYFAEKNFNNAFTSYSYALSFFKANPTNFDPNLKTEAKITDLVNKAKESMTASALQGSYKSYSSANPLGFNAFRRQNIKVINSMIADLKGYGKVSYEAIIKFDAQGKNLSSIKIDSVSNREIGGYINSISISGLAPIMRLEYYVPSLEVVPFGVSWETYNLTGNYKASEIHFKPAENISSDFNYNIGKFFNEQKYKNGTYKFEVVEKRLNGNTFTDLNLIKYKSNNGPSCAAYSLLLPGWGTSKITDGQQGKIRTILFLASAVICAGSKIYSDIEYRNYKNSYLSQGSDTYFNRANGANKVFIISGGIATITYIYDFAWVLNKGIKNGKQSGELTNKLKNGYIKIIDAPIKP
jgi:hypothetical protein